VNTGPALRDLAVQRIEDRALQIEARLRSGTEWVSSYLVPLGITGLLGSAFATGSVALVRRGGREATRRGG
jgi:hypothetical protein